MTSPLTDPELRAAEEAFERDCPKVNEMARLERERDWAHPQYSATALRDVYMLAYAAALRASPIGEAEAAVIAAAVAHRATLNPGHLTTLSVKVDALLALRAASLPDAGPKSDGQSLNEALVLNAARRPIA